MSYGINADMCNVNAASLATRVLQAVGMLQDTCNGVALSISCAHCRRKQQCISDTQAGQYVFVLQAQVTNLPFKWQVTDENLAAGLSYTSGTTGNPKVLLVLAWRDSTCIEVPEAL